MISKEDSGKIKETVKEFFKKTTFEVEIEFGSEKEESLSIRLKTEEPQILIGEGGQTLSEIQHLLKAMLRRKISAPFYIDVDVNDYKKKKVEYLKELARTTADEVSLTKKDKELSPMPAYERRIIHLELINREDVMTESAGREPERRLIIRPRP